LSTVDGRGDARERLLSRLLDAFDDELPSPDVSLREVAARAGTSHALLRYHFGSLSGVLAAMLTAQRSRDNQALAKAARDGSFDEVVTAIWRTYSRPERLSRVRGFFHVVGLAVYNPAEFQEFLGSLDDLTMMLVPLAEREGLDHADALIASTVAIAALRGLLLQELLAPRVSTDDALALVLRLTKR
jgi:AcrR family transcriptional regulator